jgi:small subunit ribosomal protein S2
MKQLLETGVHFGHRTNKWDPKMDEFIFTSRNGIHIIDLQQTLANLHEYYDMVRELVTDGGIVLFVGTKRQAQETIEKEAQRCGMPYVNKRWLGGTLTNWRTISSRIDTLKELEQLREEGQFELLTKKEALMNERKIEKLNDRLGGLRDMKRPPDLMVVVDTEREDTAVHEANILDIPVLGIVDTNANPDVIDYIVPGNDDAMRSIRLLVSAVADAVLEGKAIRKGGEIDQAADYEEEYEPYEYDEDASDEELLGEATLKKLREASLYDADDEAQAKGRPARGSSKRQGGQDQSDDN